MSDADTSGDEPVTTNINLRLTQAFLDDIDAHWKEQNYTNRSEFIRDVLRDAVSNPEFSRQMWKNIAAEEYAMRTGEGRSFSRDEIVDELERDG